MSKYFLIILFLVIGFLGFFAYKTYFDFKDTSKRVTDIPNITELSPRKDKDIPLISTVATGLEVPWGLAFLPDASILVTERAGRVRIIDREGRLGEKPVATLT